MPETVEITEVLARIETGVGDMRSRLDEVEKRIKAENKTAFERYGLNYDGEAKANLVEAAGKVADLELTLEKLRRMRTQGSLEPDASGTTPLLDAKTQKPIRFRSARERGLYTVLGSEAYGEAFESALAKHCRLDDLPDDQERLLRLKAIPEDVAKLLPAEVKATGLSTDFEQGAGIFAPPARESEITRVALEFSPFEELARTVTIGSGRYEGPFRTANRDTVTFTGERATPAQSTELKRYELRAINVHQFTVYPALTQMMIEDGTIDLGAELTTDAGEDFGVLRGTQFLKGTGFNEPKGLMVSSEIATMNSGLAATFSMDSLKKLPQQLKAIYKARGTYLLSRTALTELMLFRTDVGGAGTGEYLWEPSTQAGTPTRLNGYAWREMVDLDAVAANAFPVVFGDFFKAYRIVERRGIRVLRDDLTQDPFVVFRMSRRYGGDVWLGEAAVKMKCAV